MIQDRIILEAKRLILYTDLSLKQIGFEIGFNQPLHFSAFFRKCVESSPIIISEAYFTYEIA
jgi:AraC-like DNA-binding protein